MESLIYTQDLVIKIQKENNRLGSGGNGVVYKDQLHNVALKVLKFRVNNKGFKNSFEKKKYLRFKDEIKIVNKLQKSNTGILPIIAYSDLPDTPNKDSLIYYAMPIAVPLEDYHFNDNQDKIKCFHELFSTLKQLHEEGITHRDIKPENIYFYNGKFVFGDFGLVHYNDKENLTMDEKKVGAWTTIAPEMERDPFNSDSKKADIYSLAKTLWIIITGVKTSFEGQYNHTDETISLNSFSSWSDEYLSILHLILRDCTANNPLLRPNIDYILKLLLAWIHTDFEMLCEIEWDFILDEISQYKTSVMIWEDPEEIYRILKLISKTKSLNHTFFPSGGGLDLFDVTLHKDRSHISTIFNFNKYVMKPMKLQLNIFNDYKWNHFYLETDKINKEYIESEYYYPNSNREYLQISEIKYIEYWAKNYDVYRGYSIEKTYNEVVLVNTGSFVFFSKNSFYNKDLDRIHFKNNIHDFQLDTYSALHSKIGSADKFRLFINELIKFLKNETGLKKEFYSIVKEHGIDHSNKIEKDFTSYYNNKEIISKLNLNCLEEIDTVKDSDIMHEDFSYNIIIEYGMTKYTVCADLTLSEEKSYVDSSNFLSYLSPNQDKKEPLIVFSLSNVEKIREIIKDHLESILEEDSNNTVNFTITKKRVKKIANPIFMKDDLIEIIRHGDDLKNSILLINDKGELTLEIYNSEYKYSEYFSAQLHIFYAHENLLGMDTGDRAVKFIDNMYLEFLEILLRHLKYNSFTTTPDDFTVYTEEQLKQEILKYNDLYD